MLLGILFFLSTSFNPVYQDKKFTKENFVSKIKADVETYNINNNFLRDILPIWQTKLSLNDKNKLIEILNNITKNKNHLDNSIYFSFLNYIVLLHDSGITLLSNFSQIIGHHENQAKFKNISILDEINYVSNILKEKTLTQNKLKKIFYSGGQVFFSIEKTEEDDNDMFYFGDEEENNEELNLVINFKNIDIHVLTDNDSFKIKNSNLKYSMNEESFQGNGGRIRFKFKSRSYWQHFFGIRLILFRPK